MMPETDSMPVFAVGDTVEMTCPCHAGHVGILLDQEINSSNWHVHDSTTGEQLGGLTSHHLKHIPADVWLAHISDPNAPVNSKPVFDEDYWTS